MTPLTMLATILGLAILIGWLKIGSLSGLATLAKMLLSLVALLAMMLVSARRPGGRRLAPAL